MKVGALEETITVSGETPQVDVQSASRTQVLTRDVIDTLPVSRNVMSIGVLSPGVRQGTPDVGGSRMTEQVGLRAHGLGGDDAEQLVEGMSIQSLEGASQAYFDDMLQSEITIMTSAIPADTSGGGIRMNSVLKDGGNMFSGAAFLGFSSGSWQSEQHRRRAARGSAQHQQPERHQAHSHVHGIAGRSHQARQDVVPGRGAASVVRRDHRRRACADRRARRRGHQLVSRHLRPRPVAAADVAGRAEAQDRVVRAAVVEAQGQGLRRRAGPARVAVPRSEARASHGRQHPVDLAADQQACCSRRAIRGRCSTGWARRCPASNSRAARRCGT